MISALEILLQKNDILYYIMEYVGSIKYCIFTFSLLFKELNGRKDIEILIIEIFINIYINFYNGFFRPIMANQVSINKMYKIICPNGKKTINFEELSLLYSEKTMSYITTPHSDNYWFSNAIEEYYYMNILYINEHRLVKINFDHDNYSNESAIISWSPIHNVLLDRLDKDKSLYRFHIDGMTKSHIGEDTTVLDNLYSNILRNALNIINDDDDTLFNYIANNYESDHRAMFWAVIGLIFTVGTDYKDMPKKRDLIMKQCTIILYSRYFNNTMLLTYNVKVSDIFLNCTFIKIQFGSISEFLTYFNNTYPEAAVDLQVDTFCSLLYVDN